MTNPERASHVSLEDRLANSSEPVAPYVECTESVFGEAQQDVPGAIREATSEERHAELVGPDHRPRYRYAMAGQRLRQRRQMAGYSSRQLARLIEVDSAHISRVETGQLPISDELVERYVNAVGPMGPGEDIEAVKDEIRLLCGNAPTGLTPEDMKLVATYVQALKRARQRG